jgi:hypothetical protein
MPWLESLSIVWFNEAPVVLMPGGAAPVVLESW